MKSAMKTLEAAAVSILCTGMASLAQVTPPPEPAPPLTVTITASVAAAPSQPRVDAVTGGALTLQDCVRMALDKSPVATSAKESALGASESAAAAEAPYWPALGFVGSYSRWQRRIFLPDGLIPPGQPAPTIVGPTDDYAFSVNATYVLWDSGERKAQLGAAKARQQMGVEQELGTRQDITLSVHQAYYGYESALEIRAVAKQSLARSEDHVRIASARKDVGAVPLSDVLRAQVEVADARLAVVRSENLVRTSCGQLATAMGLPVETPLLISAEGGPLQTPDEASLPVALGDALDRRPAVKAAGQSVEAARRALDQARSAWGPKLNAAASYGREDAAWWPQDQTWAAGVTLSIPLFTGFSRVHNEARARADLAKSESDLQQVTLSVRQQVWNAFSSFREAYEAVSASEELVKTAAESHRLAKERYEVGAGTITDLLDAETALAKAQTSLVSAQWSCRAAWSQYRWSVGDLLP